MARRIDSLLILKDLKLINDDIIRIIPYKQLSDFFNPFYETIKEKLQTEELLPANDGTYISKENAYWAVAPDLTQLFSNKQLALLTKNPNAKWVFTTIGRTKDTDITEYIDGGNKSPRNYKEPNLITNNVDFENDIAKWIDGDFIERQSFEWLHKFYEYLSERKSYQDKFKTKSIFKDSKGNAVAAYDEKKELILFLPTDSEISSYITTVHKSLLKNKTSKDFIHSFGIKQPSFRNEIYNCILPLYDEDGNINTDKHFEKFFQYYKECPNNEIDSFIQLLEDKAFVSYYTKDDDTTYHGKANEIYYPSDDLLAYFETKPDTKFLDLDNYRKQVNKSDWKLFEEFIGKLGVCELPRIFKTELNGRQRDKYNLSYYTQYSYLYEFNFDGLEENLNFCSINSDMDKRISISTMSWKYLVAKFKQSINNSNFLKFHHNYFYRQDNNEYLDSPILTQLREKKWLVTKNGKFVAPHEITINELSDEYDKSNKLIELMGFKPLIVLSEEERIARMFENEDEAKLAKHLLDVHKAKQNAQREIRYPGEANNESNDWLDSITKDNSEKFQIIESQQNEDEKEERKMEIFFNEDEEFAKGVDELKKQLEIKKSRVDLVSKINESKKYSYEWFEAYLKLLNTYGEKQSTTKQKSVSFLEIKPYKTDNKYFLLCGANNYISSEIENAEDFHVSFVFGNGKKENITVEGVSKKGQDLLIYCRESLPTNILSRLSSIFRIEIKFTPVIDLLDRLYKAFTHNNYIDKWQDIEEAMPSLNYIYGPPGTGKTTALCNKINEIVTDNANAKFLVLTPTNKAADVLCKKLWDINSDIFAVRLGHPTDPDLEEEALYRDTVTSDDLNDINAVVSTIHRLPYFEITHFGKLFQVHWDYVIFDESSMIGLHYIVFAIFVLYKTNSKTKFIIAGDPKQIPPVIEVNDSELENFDFQDENIYKMLGLESFNPTEQRIREQDEIKNLDMQYRSVKPIGQLFSELSYSKLLKHDRETNRKETKPLPEEFKKLVSANVTFIDIPLNQDNSIYKINKLLYSSYQAYCVILVAEIIKFFDKKNDGEQWTIGLIAPYKAQAILLNKLVTSYRISEKVKIYSDTVHGFQGDECDIVFFVCNPNNYYYTGHEKCLLSKEYIYNVSISRAKDYLVILHPYLTIKNNTFINKIKNSYRNNKFGVTRIIQATEVEKLLFNEEKHIENNSYTTGHDNVNVFGTSKMEYFIKANDNAIDIQLRK
jgi:hypothetical protein